MAMTHADLVALLVHLKALTSGMRYSAVDDLDKMLSALKSGEVVLCSKEMEPPELLASRLIDVWCADKGKQIPWAKAVQIVAIVTKQPDDERDRLLRLGEEDGSCGMCGRPAIDRAMLAAAKER